MNLASLTYLRGYPEHLLAQCALIAEQRLEQCAENVIPARMITPLAKALYHSYQELKVAFCAMRRPSIK